MPLELEDAWAIVGPFGSYQRTAILIAGAGWAAGACPALIMPFITAPPSWRYLDEPAGLEFTSGEGCENVFIASRSWEWVSPLTSLNSDLTSGPATPCSAGASQAVWASTAFFLGVLCGAPVLSAWADVRGRRPLLFGCLLAMMAAHGASALSHSFFMYSLCRFVTGFFNGGAGIMCFVYPSEVVGKEFRGQVMLWVSLGWSAGALGLTATAYLVRGWRPLTLVTALSGGVFLLGPIQYIEESPGFCLAKGCADRAAGALGAIARRNGASEAALAQLQAWRSSASDLPPRGGAGDPKVEQQEGLVDLVQQLPRRLAFMGLLWMSASLAYYGISLGVGNLGDDIYSAAALSALVEVPSYPLTTWMVGRRRFGRRRSLMIFMSLTVAACVIASQAEGVARMAVAMIGKFAVSAAFAIVFLYGAELFPASVRSSAMGIQSTMARVGGVLAPQILALPGPMLMFGLISSIALPGIPLLPETLGKPIPTTLAEAAAAGNRDVLTVSQAFGYAELDEEDDDAGASSHPAPPSHAASKSKGGIELGPPPQSLGQPSHEI